MINSMAQAVYEAANHTRTRRAVVSSTWPIYGVIPSTFQALRSGAIAVCGVALAILRSSGIMKDESFTPHSDGSLARSSKGHELNGKVYCKCEGFKKHSEMDCFLTKQYAVLFVDHVANVCTLGCLNAYLFNVSDLFSPLASQG